MNSELLHDALAGLSAPEKTLPCKWFYDHAGSLLFEQICELPEYYPTRVELSILQNHAPEIAAHLGENAALIEPGSGSSLKTRVLLHQLPALRAYVPLDISDSMLEASAKSLRSEFPDLPILPVVADYTREVSLPPLQGARRVLFFPGSTIGNFSRQESAQFLESLARWSDQLLIGVDLRKSPEILLPAYNDSQGVTAQFNLNLLARINRECGANFDLEKWQHRAIWNETDSRIEMQLISTQKQSVRLGNQEIEFMQGEVVTTEWSHKYGVEEFSELAQSAGWCVESVWLDEKKWFSLQLLRAC